MNTADESPATVIRRAAELWRKRARSATPGPWRASHDHDDWYVTSGHGQVSAGVHDDPGVTDLVLIERDHRDAEYIASMHPLVALAVADLLEEVARQYDAPPCDSPGGACGRCDRRDDFNDALRLARAYLGEESGS